MIARSCPACSVEFVPENPRRVYCSRTCRVQHHNRRRVKRDWRQRVCGDCGRPFVADQKRQMYCPECRTPEAVQARNTAAKRRVRDKDKPPVTMRAWYEQLAEQGWLERDGDTWRLTDVGRRHFAGLDCPMGQPRSREWPPQAGRT